MLLPEGLREMSEILSFDAAVAVYKVLVSVCGASTNTDHHASFIFAVGRPWPTAVHFTGSNSVSGGKLGIGGQFVRWPCECREARSG